MDELVKYALTSGLSIVGVLIIIFILLVFFPEKIDKHISLWSSVFARYSNKAEKNAVGRDLQAHFNTYVKLLKKDSPQINMPKIKIEWVDSENIESSLKEDEFIIRLCNHEERKKNYVTAALIYVESCLLTHSKIYLEKIVREAIQYYEAGKIISYDDKEGIYAYFLEEYLQELLDKREFKNLYEKCIKIDERGLFSRILLYELMDLGIRNYPRLPDRKIKQETKEFISYLSNIVTRLGEIRELEFNKTYIKTATVLVGKDETLLLHGEYPYIRRIKINISKGIKNIFVLSAGRKVINTKQIVKSFEKSNKVSVLPYEVFDYEFPDGFKVPALLVLIKNGYQIEEAISTFKNIKFLEGVKTIMERDKKPIGFQKDEICPSSGLEIINVYKYKGMYFFDVNLLRFDSEKREDLVTYNTIDANYKDSLSKVAELFSKNKFYPEDAKEYNKIRQVYSTYYKENEKGYLDVFDLRFDPSKIILKIDLGKCFDSICIDIGNTWKRI